MSDPPADPNLYDEVPYRSRPIEWTAPERLALCSALHGGPRLPLHGYRVLELGCGNGANLLPLAFYRRDATFVGVNGSAHAIETADARRREVALENLRFLRADFESAPWTPESNRRAVRFRPRPRRPVVGVPAVRNRLLDLCAANVAPGGVLYVNYNCRPGWDVRGIVRRLLLAQTESERGLRARTEAAFQVASTLAASLHGVEHPFAQLLERELQFVLGSDKSYVAHEFLAPHNHAYWRSEWLRLLAQRGLVYVADADFNYTSGRLTPGLVERIRSAGLDRGPIDDVVNLLSYRQLHTALFTPQGASRRPFQGGAEIAAMHLATPVRPIEGEADERALLHPAGFQVERDGAGAVARSPGRWSGLAARPAGSRRARQSERAGVRRQSPLAPPSRRNRAPARGAGVTAPGPGAARARRSAGARTRRIRTTTSRWCRRWNLVRRRRSLGLRAQNAVNTTQTGPPTSVPGYRPSSSSAARPLPSSNRQ